MKRRNLTIIAIGLISIAFILFLVSRSSKNGTELKSSQHETNQKNLQNQQNPVQGDDLGKKNLEFRNNWYKYISVNCIGYQPYHPEGIKDWTLTISNNTDYKLDYVKVEISYVLANRQVYQTKPFVFRDVDAKATKTEKIPESDKGITIKWNITEMKATPLSFCYDFEYDALINKKGKFATPGGLSGNPDDPWKCK